MREVIIVAGPNGAGKSTFIVDHLRVRPDSFVRLDADEIQKQLAATRVGEQQHAIKAGRLLLEKMQALVDARQNLMVETTLALKLYADRIPAWQQSGYSVRLIYLRLESVEMAIERVRRRVARGGHNILEEVVRRRFERSLKNLELIYKPIVDQWDVWDSIEGDFVRVSSSEVQ
jgi:predicted ABC-type ATPase